MNLLLHRHFARIELGDRVAGFGAMLPDLVRLVDRTWRPQPELARTEPATDAVTSILDGIEHHIASDIWFHRRPELREGERRTAEAFRAAGVTARRLPLFAHPTWEMLLDGALARREGVDVVEAVLRDECGELSHAAEEAMARHGGARTWAVAPEALARLWSVVPALASGYATAPGLARRLDGLRASIGLPRADDVELARWCDALAALEPAADAALDALVLARGASHRG